MNRLTETQKSIEILSKYQFIFHGTDYCHLLDALEQLKRYEDTGLEPKDILSNIKTLSSELNNAFGELKEYRKLEEQGLLIKLPCKVGDKVYVNKNCLNDWYCFLESKLYTRCEVIGVKKTKKQVLLNLKPLTERTANTRYHVFFPFSAIGKTVFLTREEAEKALEGK